MIMILPATVEMTVVMICSGGDGGSDGDGDNHAYNDTKNDIISRKNKDRNNNNNDENTIIAPLLPLHVPLPRLPPLLMLLLTTTHDRGNLDRIASHCAAQHCSGLHCTAQHCAVAWFDNSFIVDAVGSC